MDGTIGDRAPRFLQRIHGCWQNPCRRERVRRSGSARQHSSQNEELRILIHSQTRTIPALALSATVFSLLKTRTALQWRTWLSVIRSASWGRAEAAEVDPSDRAESSVRRHAGAAILFQS